VQQRVYVVLQFVVGGGAVWKNTTLLLPEYNKGTANIAIIVVHTAAAAITHPGGTLIVGAASCSRSDLGYWRSSIICDDE